MSIITRVQIASTPGMIARPTSTPPLPPVSSASIALPPALPSRTSRNLNSCSAFSPFSRGIQYSAVPYVFFVNCIMILTLMMLPITAPTLPTITARPACPPFTFSPIINVDTIIPIPKDVPRFVRAGSWNLRKYFLKFLSSASPNIAGLSDK